MGNSIGGGRGFRSLFLASVLSLAAPFPADLIAGQAQAAVQYEDTLDDPDGSPLRFPVGAAVSPNGDVYVADTSNHRIIKFDDDGQPLLAFGSEGSGRGQLYYPNAVTVGLDRDGRTRVFVADTHNSRIVVFTEAGRYVRSFGTFGGGDGQYNYPGSIVFAGDRLIVADTRNGRVAEVTTEGRWLGSGNCSDCPDGPFVVPLGIAYRPLESGRREYYVTDEYTGRVHVLNGALDFKRVFGVKGVDEGELAYPDDIAVAKDGTSYVADSGIGAERISAFDANGTFLFSFSWTGAENFVSPHGVALDPDGHLYVVSTAASEVHKFRLVPSKLWLRDTLDERSTWRANSAAIFSVRYNGVEQACDASGTATISVPAGGSRTFNVRGREPAVTSAPFQSLKMALTDEQMAEIEKAWRRGKQIGVSATFVGRCEDGQVLRPPKRVFKL